MFLSKVPAMCVVACLSLGVASAGSAAHAAWTTAGGGSAASAAQTMPAGNRPSASVSGRNATLSWSASTFASGASASGYLVRRYDSSGVSQTVADGCSGVVPSLGCVEKGITPGDWAYSVVPVQGNWSGPESPRSAVVTVGSPRLTFSSSTTITSLPSTLNGTVSNFKSGQSVTFKLDDPASGSALTSSASPQSIPGDGGAAVSVTIPAGTSDGAHTVYALGSDGDQASAAITVNAAPKPVSLVIANGGVTPGKPEVGDTVTIRFSQRLAVSSLCSTWSGDDANQSIVSGVNVTIKNNAAASGNDQLLVAVTGASCGGSFRFGSVDLGSKAFVNKDALYGSSSSIAWNADDFLLVVTLGATAGNSSTVSSAVTATYTPDSSITNPSGAKIAGTASNTAVQF